MDQIKSRCSDNKNGFRNFASSRFEPQKCPNANIIWRSDSVVEYEVIPNQPINSNVDTCEGIFGKYSLIGSKNAYPCRSKAFQNSRNRFNLFAHLQTITHRHRVPPWTAAIWSAFGFDKCCYDGIKKLAYFDWALVRSHADFDWNQNGAIDQRISLNCSCCRRINF